MPSINKNNTNFLDRIMNSNDAKMQQNKIAAETSNRYVVQHINTEDIIFNPGNDIFNKNDTEEDIKILADNIEVVGLIEPIVVIKQGTKYMLLSGERRTKAFRLKGWRKIPAFIFDSEEEFKQVSTFYTANLYTRHMDNGQIFLAYRRYIQYCEDNNRKYTNEEIAKMLNNSKRSVQRLSQLNKNASEIDIELLEKGEITYKEFKKRTLEYISEQQKELDARKKLLSKSVDFKSYIDNNLNTVYSVIKVSENSYCTCFTNKESFKVTVMMPNLPMRKTAEDAQVDLDVVAASNGYDVYLGDLSEFKPKEDDKSESLPENDKSSSDTTADTKVEMNFETVEQTDNETPKTNFTSESSDEPSLFDNAREDNDEETQVTDIEDTVSEETVDNTDSNTNAKGNTPERDEISESNDTVDEHTYTGQIADFTARDIYTKEFVRGALFFKNGKPYIITSCIIGAQVGKSKYSITGTAVEVIASTIIRNDV